MLNQSGEEPIECPLCMEPLEVDDIAFFPCTCGYQICRFCWHRIRTDENGLCPACRKPYSENPADFRPLSREEVAHLKAQKKQKIQKRKQKITENRKHLANIRVVQRNLVFVVGLPTRLADTEVLKKHEYFGKYGKIQKVVLNQSTSYAGSQGPSASAYVTYHKADDALRAIQAVNNVMVDGRCIRSSLGTTKYCSHFLKNQMCPKAECMYLHELGDAEASFSKEEVQQGKHREYEKKLHEQLLNAGKDRKSVPSVVVPPTITNYQNMNTTTSCPTYVQSNVKEVHADCHGSGCNSDNFASSPSGDCKGSHINRKTEVCQMNNVETSYTSDKETQRKKDCEVLDESDSKEMSPVQDARLNLKHNSDKLNSSEVVSKSNSDSPTQILESENNPKDSANVDSNEVEQLEGEKGCLLPVKRPVMNSSSFFPTESLNAQEAVNVQGILPPEKWRSIFHFPALSSSTNVQEWNHSPCSSLSGIQTMSGTSQLHSFNYDKNSCGTDFKDLKRHNQNSSYLINKFHTSPIKSEGVAGTFVSTVAVDRQMNRLEDSATATHSCVQNATKPQPISNMSMTPPFLHYDPAILMVNQFSGGSSGSQFLFMNGQPSEVTKRFLEDVQKAQQQKQHELQYMHNCLELGATRKLVVNSEFNDMHCNTEMVNKRDMRVNGYQNDRDKLPRIQEQPPGFLYHQNKNKHANLKYINSVNPIMSAVQITNNKQTSDDELGFDPFHETQKALTEMMEKENKTQNGLHNQHNTMHHSPKHQDGYHSVDSFSSRQKSILPQQKNSYRPPPNVTECENFLNGLGLYRGISSGTSSRARLPPPGFTAPCQIQSFSIPHSSSEANVQSECFRRKHQPPFKK